ncbi:MAG: c-type cytochrome [Planctomycetes bacterium]|nr:c-type cytochrome [Planctomycetota bacterium]
MRSWLRRLVVGHAMVITLVGLGVDRARGEDVVAATRNETDAIHPNWLSVGGHPVPLRLAKTFQVGSSVQSGTLKFAADFCRVRVEINGEPVVVVEPYTQTESVDVTNWLRHGENTIEIVVEQLSDGPAVVAATLITELVDKSRRTVATDPTWEVRTDGAAATSPPARPQSRGLVADELWGIGRRDISLSPFENYEQWQQAKGSGGQSPRFWIAPGFEITQLRTAREDDGSWVSLAVDPQGRLTIGREDQGFLRMTLTSDAKQIDRVEPIPANLLECRGLVYRNGWLYANANNSKTLFRLKLTEAGQATDITPLREFPGGVGHGRNDLALTANSLHLICGDSVDLPRSEITDWTSPFRAKVAGPQTREGFLLRSTLEGTNWELFCAGLRNPYGVAIDPRMGDAFTFDADNEFDLGMPWYRPTRVLSLQAGGDYGYREATGSLPPRFSDQPDNALPLIDIGRSSPTAVIFGNEFAFPAPYCDALFLLDWTYGRVLVVHLTPRGARWRAATELFLQGKPLNVTDVAAGRDGAMYLITGGRKTQSALYRISPLQREASSRPATERGASETEFASLINAHAGRNRRAIQMLNDPATAPSILVRHLNDADPTVRYAARTALERIPVEKWRALVLAPSPELSIHGLLALARGLDSKDVPAILTGVQSIDMARLPIGSRLLWLRIIDLCLIANREVVLEHRTALKTMTIAGWKACASPVRQVACEGTNLDFRRRAALLLTALGSDRLPELAASDLLSTPHQEDQISGLLALRDHRTGWTPELRERQFETLRAMPLMVGGDGLPKFHKWIEAGTLATLNAEERSRYDMLLKADASAAEASMPPVRPFVKAWNLDDLTAATDESAGDVEKGAAVFRAVMCARCHRVGSRGPAIGPDLTFVSRRFSRRDILESILIPSKSVAENYRIDVIQTKGGKVHTGRVLIGGDFRAEKIKLSPDPLRPDVIVEIDKKEIEEHHQSAESPMPKGLLDSLTATEIVDLLAYLTRPPRPKD